MTAGVETLQGSVESIVKFRNYKQTSSVDMRLLERVKYV